GATVGDHAGVVGFEIRRAVRLVEGRGLAARLAGPFRSAQDGSPNHLTALVVDALGLSPLTLGSCRGGLESSFPQVGCRKLREFFSLTRLDLGLLLGAKRHEVKDDGLTLVVVSVRAGSVLPRGARELAEVSNGSTVFGL